MSPRTPAAVLERQFRNLRETRRHVYSLLPLRRVSSIVEPGCGTGLLARELLPLTTAAITCVDSTERSGLPPGCVFAKADATAFTPRADIYISSFFLYQLSDPAAYLRKVGTAMGKGGLYAVAGEFSYENPGGCPVISALASSLRDEGHDPMFGSILEKTFGSAGYSVVETGRVNLLQEAPDLEFIGFQLGTREMPVPDTLAVPVHWGVFRFSGNRG